MGPTFRSQYSFERFGAGGSREGVGSALLRSTLFGKNSTHLRSTLLKRVFFDKTEKSTLLKRVVVRQIEKSNILNRVVV